MVVESVIPYGNLGFFSKPVAYDNKSVLKRYNGVITCEETEELSRLHRAFILNLSSIGIAIPETQLCFEQFNGGFRVRVVQDRFDAINHAGHIIRNSSGDDAVKVETLILEDSLKFIDSPLLGEMGFHPTVRNYAVKDGIPYYLDTFPPCGTERETKRLMVRHAPSEFWRLLMLAGYPLLGVYTREYYNPKEMFCGIVGTATRLRPDCADELKDVARRLLARNNYAWKGKGLEQIARYPSKPLKWRFSSVLGH